MDEYKEVSERYEFMKTQIEDVEKSKRELSKMIDELTDKMSIQFKEKFVIDEYFRATFRELFGGGAAELFLKIRKMCLNVVLKSRHNLPERTSRA